MYLGKILTTILFLFICVLVLAQGEIDNGGTIFFKNERTYALLINTNGWGFNYRYGKRLDGYRKFLYDFDIVGIKHPKEFKTRNPYFDTNKRFFFGKQNSFYSFRSGIGYQKEIFSKFDKGAISIRYFYSGGISIGILKPIYYEIIDSISVSSGSNYTLYIKTKKFDPLIHDVDEIYGKASFFLGFNELSIIPGLLFKYGYSFEFSSESETIKALEAGINIEAFYKPITIMANEEKSQIFLTLFLSYRFGKVISNRVEKGVNRLKNSNTQNEYE